MATYLRAGDADDGSENITSTQDHHMSTFLPLKRRRFALAYNFKKKIQTCFKIMVLKSTFTITALKINLKIIIYYFNVNF